MRYNVRITGRGGGNVKKAIAVLAATAVALCASIGLWHEDAALPADPPAIVEAIPAAPDPDPQDGEPDEERRTRRALSGAKTVLRLLFAAPLSFLGHAVTAVLGAVGTTLLTAVTFVLRQVLGTFLALLAVLCILFKALFPDRPLRELLTRKNLLLILLVSVLLPLACRILEMTLPNARYLVPVLRAVLVMLVTVWLWHKAFGLRGRFFRRIRRLFWCRQGICLALLVLLLCGVRVLLSIAAFSGGSQLLDVFDSLLVYSVAAATAFAIYRRVIALRKRHDSMRLVAECDGFRAELPLEKETDNI